MAKQPPKQPKPQILKDGKYNHEATQAAYRKATRTSYGAKHGNAKRQFQGDHTSDKEH